LCHVLPQACARGTPARQFRCLVVSRAPDYDQTVGPHDRSDQPTEDSTMAKLSAEEIAQKLKSLPGWEYKDNAIVKMFRFKEFLHGIEFVQKVAEIAEAADHHPDIHINYTRVTFICSTHDAGGVTEKDFKLAENIEIAFKDRNG
jgi:4a-hydroxytetrahydrobiopterin dehydratase